MANQERICRLCLKVCDNFKALERHMKDVLYTVLPKINLTVIQEPMICTNCLEMLIKCFDFKTNCIYIQNCVLPFVDKDNVKPDLRDAHLMENVNGADIPAGQDIICGSCMGLLNNCSAISLDVEGDVMLKKIIKECLPKWDLSIIKKPVICAPCHLSLENCFRFVTNCLNVEEKINKYCESLDINSEGQIELSNLLEFTMGDIRKDDAQPVDVTKVKEQFFEESENSEERKIDIEMVKLEPMICEEGSFVEMEDQKFLVKEEIEIKPDMDLYRSEDNINLPQPSDVRRKCLMPNHEEDLLKLHVKYKSRNENAVKLPGYRCDCCSYRTKNKSDLKKHFLKHKDPLEITIHKCVFCPFQSQRKCDLKNHLLVHKDPSEVTVYNCPSCAFQTKHRHSLEAHVLLHKNSSEVTMYKCDSCSFQTRRKGYLKTHLLLHESPTKITMYNCDFCSFQTKYKQSLRKHLLLHKGPSEVTIYKCGSCAYETTQKCDLKTHLLRSNHVQL